MWLSEAKSDEFSTAFMPQQFTVIQLISHTRSFIDFFFLFFWQSIKITQFICSFSLFMVTWNFRFFFLKCEANFKWNERTNNLHDLNIIWTPSTLAQCIWSFFLWNNTVVYFHCVNAKRRKRREKKWRRKISHKIINNI